MNTDSRSSSYFRPSLEAIAIVIGLAAVTYSLFTGASFLLGLFFAIVCWLAALLDWYLRNE